MKSLEKEKFLLRTGKYIEVKFGKVVKKFVLPGAIAEKHLKVSDEKILEFYNKCDDIHKQILKGSDAASFYRFCN